RDPDDRAGRPLGALRAPAFALAQGRRRRLLDRAAHGGLLVLRVPVAGARAAGELLTWPRWPRPGSTTTRPASPSTSPCPGPASPASSTTPPGTSRMPRPSTSRAAPPPTPSS